MKKNQGVMVKTKNSRFFLFTVFCVFTSAQAFGEGHYAYVHAKISKFCVYKTQSNLDEEKIGIEVSSTDGIHHYNSIELELPPGYCKKEPALKNVGFDFIVFKDKWSNEANISALNVYKKNWLFDDQIENSIYIGTKKNLSDFSECKKEENKKNCYRIGSMIKNPQKINFELKSQGIDLEVELSSDGDFNHEYSSPTPRR